MEKKNQRIKYYITQLSPEIEILINSKIVSCAIIEKTVILARYETNKTALKEILKKKLG